MTAKKKVSDAGAAPAPKVGEKITVKGVKLKAISQGYYEGVIIEVGKSFSFDGDLRVVDGKVVFPLWTEGPKDFKITKVTPPKTDGDDGDLDIV